MDDRETREWIEKLADPVERDEAIRQLRARGPAAHSLLIDALHHRHASVRRFICTVLDHMTQTDEIIAALVNALDDPNRKVRHGALHALTCDGCKTEGCLVDVEQLLIDRLHTDPSTRVRRYAASSLAAQVLHGSASALQACRSILRNDSDPSVRSKAAGAVAFSEMDLSDPDWTWFGRRIEELLAS